MNTQLSLAIDWLPLAIAGLVSIIVTGMMVIVGVRLGRDKSEGVQKFHTKPTSRLGGIGIGLGLFTGLWLSKDHYSNDAVLGLWLLAASLPVFVGGLVEDLTHSVTPRMRLILASISALLIFATMQLGVTRTDIAPIDWLLSIPGLTWVLTVLVVAGFINSVNIIDGFHGLASGAVMVMLLGIAAMAFMADDGLVMRLCLITGIATFGFYVWNWPFGKIFLGDGGAYLLGLWVVELGLLLPYRTPTISPMAPVLAGIYPLVETLCSMHRRKFIRMHPVNHPDALHLHSLIYRRLILNPALDISSADKNRANAKVSVIVCSFIAMPVTLAVIFSSNTEILLIGMIVFTLAYIKLYKSLVRFSTPTFLLSKSRR